MTQAPFAVPPGGSRFDSEVPSTHKIRVKVSGKDTSGAFTVLEVTTAPDAGSPLHIHHIENEWFYTLEGEYEIQVGGQVYHLPPGAGVYGPKLIPHAWHDVGTTPSKMLVIAEPAGNMEAFSEELESLRSGATPRDPTQARAFFEKYDLEIVGPPLPKKFVNER